MTFPYTFFIILYLSIYLSIHYFFHLIITSHHHEGMELVSEWKKNKEIWCENEKDSESENSDALPSSLICYPYHQVRKTVLLTLHWDTTEQELYTHTCTYVYSHTHTHTHMCWHTYTHTHTHTSIQIHMYIHEWTSILTFISTCTHAHMCTYTVRSGSQTARRQRRRHVLRSEKLLRRFLQGEKIYREELKEKRGRWKENGDEKITKKSNAGKEIYNRKESIDMMKENT